jgi:hypothetical protein
MSKITCTTYLYSERNPDMPPQKVQKLEDIRREYDPRRHVALLALDYNERGWKQTSEDRAFLREWINAGCSKSNMPSLDATVSDIQSWQKRQRANDMRSDYVRRIAEGMQKTQAKHEVAKHHGVKKSTVDKEIMKFNKRVKKSVKNTTD